MNALPHTATFNRAENGQETLVNATLLVGRVALGLLFAVSGYGQDRRLFRHRRLHGLQGPEAQAQMTQFLKNLSILGGMLYVAAFGSGAWSADRR